jgi:UPF0176 protein
VFDQRVGLDPALRETSSVLCFHCQAPLTAEEQADSRYQPPHSCPYCYQSRQEQMTDLIQQRHAALQCVSHPLPGSISYDNERPFIVPQDQEGETLLDCLCLFFPQIPRQEWQIRCDLGRFFNQKKQVLGAASRVKGGERLTQLFPNITEPPINPDVRVLFEDDAIVILNKPAPLPMHPSGRYHRNTLEYLLDRAYKPTRLRPAHRLDANTTGLVICGKNRHMAGLLQPQFERGEVEKTYLVRVQGKPEEEQFFCDAPISQEPGLAGARGVDLENGVSARTDFRILSHCVEDSSTLLEARPRTGRTNQIRVHLWHLGFPVCGDPTYLAEGQSGTTQTLAPDDLPLCLHCWRMTFTHPVSKERVSFEAVPPIWT